MTHRLNRLLLRALTTTLLAMAAAAQAQQQPAPLPPTPSPQKPAQDDKATPAQSQFQQEEQQRMLGIVPAFRVVLSGSAPPINSRQKFELFAKDAFDPFSFAAAGADAAWEQYRNDYPTWGTQADGFGKRFAGAFGDELDGNLWARAILPSVLHQDPRYFRLGHGGFFKRTGNAIAAIARCKGDNGHWQPNYSVVSGDLIAGAVSNVYYPSSERGIGLTFQRGFTVVGVGAVSNFAGEFYPDVVSGLKSMFKHKEPKPDLPPSLWPPH